MPHKHKIGGSIPLARYQFEFDMNVNERLTSAGVKFTTKNVFSGFHGTKYEFPTLVDAKKAEKATGFDVHGKRGNYHFILY